jgi:hypothetical protein
MAAAALALVASTSLFCATTSPAAAQEWSDRDVDIGDGDMQDRMDRGDWRDRLPGVIRDIVQDLIREHAGRRGEFAERIRDRGNLRDDLMDLVQDRRDLRDRLRERVSSWRDRQESDGDWRSRLRERIAERRGGEDGDLRGRLRERIAERRGGEDGENCLFLTRTLRDEDRNFFVLVRRRVCRD